MIYQRFLINCTKGTDGFHIATNFIKCTDSNLVVKRCLSWVVQPKPNEKSYSLVVIGGGSGGLSVASRLARLNKGPVAVIEPSNVHYYQPIWTLVGAGLKDLSSSACEMGKVMPKNVDWVKDSCAEIDPVNCKVRLASNDGTINYKYLVVATGINIDWDKIEGLSEALETPGVCSNYSAKTVLKTYKAIQDFKEGNAIFTFPNTPVKCPGAPQKIMYLTECNFRENGKRDKATFMYNTALPVIFGVKHYANSLMEICKKRDLNVNFRHNLVRVDPLTRTAYFQKLDHPGDPLVEIQYEMLHVTPPMSAPKVLAPLASETSNGFVAVDPKTLQHTKYSNIFALGDCSSLPTSKTAAAIASQNYILTKNLMAFMENNGKGKVNFPELYDGYTSCPLVTGSNKCIMAEFDYKLEPLETFPINQSKERQLMYYVKKDVLPFVYWNAMLKGHWSGPSAFRRLMSFGTK